MKTVAYIACSLDGFIAKKDGNIDWLTGIPNPTNEDHGFSDFMKTIDAILMGRNTFQTVEKFDEWPYEKKVYVLSNSLKAIDKKLSGKAELINGNLPEIITTLEKSGIHRLYVDGGKTIQSFLEIDSLDEMIITTISKLLGDGIPLFGKNEKEMDFELTKSERLNEYMVKNYYKRRR